jgi:hypothetical protein
MKIVFINLLIFISIIAQGQKEFHWNTIYHLPFKEDSIQSFQNAFSQFKELESIKNSTSLMEIRYYENPFYGRNSTFIYQVKYIQGNLEEYVYFNDINIKIDLENVEVIGKLGRFPFYRKKIIVDPKLDSFIYQIFTQGLLTLPDQKNLIDSFKKNIEIYHYNNNKSDIRKTHTPGGNNFLEVKIGDKYRNFRIAQQPYGYYFFNKEIKIFKDYNDLFNLLTTIFNSSLITN